MGLFLLLKKVFLLDLISRVALQSVIEKKVLDAIKLFFLELNVKSGGIYKLKRKTSNTIQIIEEKESKLSENRKLKLNLNINDHSFLNHILVPFFNKLNFVTKKELDFKD